MKTQYFKSFPTPVQIKDLVELLRGLEFQKNSGCVKIGLDEANHWGLSKTNEILRNYSAEYDLLKEIFEDQKNEAKILANLLSDFLTGETQFQNHISVYEELFRLMIRVYRMLEIQNPDYSVTKAFNKKMGKDYETSKGFWISDECERVRAFSKNLGEKGWDLEKNMEKLLDRLGYKITELQRGNYKDFRADLLIQKDESSFLVELKVRDKEKFFDSYMAVEMWILYKSIYGV